MEDPDGGQDGDRSVHAVLQVLEVQRVDADGEILDARPRRLHLNVHELHRVRRVLDRNVVRVAAVSDERRVGLVGEVHEVHRCLHDPVLRGDDLRDGAELLEEFVGPSELVVDLSRDDRPALTG